MTPEEIRKACRRALVPPEVESAFVAYLPSVLEVVNAEAQAEPEGGKGK